MAGDFEWRILKLEETVDHHDTDFYRGRGKNDPSFNERLSTVEETVRKLNNNLSKIVWLILATLASVIGGLVFKH